jgi:hypothetical protein
MKREAGRGLLLRQVMFLDLLFHPSPPGRVWVRDFRRPGGFRATRSSCPQDWRKNRKKLRQFDCVRRCGYRHRSLGWLQRHW